MEVIEIRGNINSTFSELERLRKEKEEREKKEAEAKRERERLEREKREAEWKEKHPMLAKHTYVSFFNHETYTWDGQYVDVKFYEWSNVYAEPRQFKFFVPFCRFLDECGVTLEDEDISAIKLTCGCHVICKPGCSNAVMGKTYVDMVDRFNEAKAAAKVLATVPAVINAGES